jgi:ribokinase
MIVVFGSLIADLLFAVPRLPRPGETVLGERYLMAAGGKGANQALAAARDGARVAMAGAVGRDAFSEVVMGGLRAAGVDLTHVLSLDTPTGCAAVGVDGAGDNQIMVASGANALARAEQVPDALLGPDTLLLVQMELDRRQTEALIGRARARGCRIMLNLAPALTLSDAALRAVDWLLVNEIEAASLAGQCNSADASPEALARTLGVTVIATYAARGAVAFASDGVVKVPALVVDVVDTTGAGDAFAGVLAAALDRGASLEAGLRRAAVAGSLSCTARGAQTALPDRAAIDAALARLS